VPEELSANQQLIMSGDLNIPDLSQLGQTAMAGDGNEEQEEKRRRLTPYELDQRALAGFLDRAREFLANDPYWMHVLTMQGGRRKRRQVADAFSKLMTTIPHIESDRPNRKVRRAFVQSLPSDLVKASGVKASDLS
jgi:hypothetical protein